MAKLRRLRLSDDALSALPLLGASLELLTSAGADAVQSPIEATFGAPGPFATTTGTVTEGSTVVYDLYYPSNYRSMKFKSPIVTWGNWTGAASDQYSSLLLQFASDGFTAIASTLQNTGSGREMDEAAHYLVKMNATWGSVFDGRLNVHRAAAVGHSQGAIGAARVAIHGPDVDLYPDHVLAPCSEIGLNEP